MRIILSPAKKMVVNNDYFEYQSLPEHLEKTEKILAVLKQKDSHQLKEIWKCNDSIVEENIERLSHMDLYSGLSAAIFSYDGIAFKYLSADVLQQQELDYVNEHLRILSAFYGALKPMDGVRPYRLEMQADLKIDQFKNLYDFWSDELYQSIKDKDHIIINLASDEYAKCIRKYLGPQDRFITISFVENVKGKMVTKGTYAKMARGEMVRYMAENQIEDVEEIKNFNRLGYIFKEQLSTNNEFVFEKVK